MDKKGEFIKNSRRKEGFTQNEQKELVAKLLNLPINMVEKNSGFDEELNALYFGEKFRGGRSILVANDGSVLFWASCVNPNHAREEFKNGVRTPLEAFDKKIPFTSACENAQAYFKSSYGMTALRGAKETDSAYIFFVGKENDPPMIGGGVCIVDKKTGETKDFYLPSEKNFDILDNAKEKEVPSKFKK